MAAIVPKRINRRPAALRAYLVLLLGVGSAGAQTNPAPLEPGTQPTPVADSPAPPSPAPAPPAPPPLNPAPSAQPGPAAPPAATGFAPQRTSAGNYSPSPQPARPAPGYAYPPPWAAPAPTDPRPKYLPYRPGEAAPEGYVYDERARRGPIIGGLITFAVPYSLSLLVTAQDSANKKSLLLIPGLGPWLTLLARDSSCDQSLPIHDCTEDSSARLVLVIDGMLQTAGIVIAATGLMNPQKRYVRSDWAPQVSLAPRLIGKAPGLGLSGTF